MVTPEPERTMQPDPGARGGSRSLRPVADGGRGSPRGSDDPALLVFGDEVPLAGQGPPLLPDRQIPGVAPTDQKAAGEQGTSHWSLDLVVDPIACEAPFVRPIVLPRRMEPDPVGFCRRHPLDLSERRC